MKTGARGNGMAVDRLRNLAKKLQVPAKASFDTNGGGFTLRVEYLSERGAKAVLNFLANEEVAPLTTQTIHHFPADDKTGK